MVVVAVVMEEWRDEEMENWRIGELERRDKGRIWLAISSHVRLEASDSKTTPHPDPECECKSREDMRLTLQILTLSQIMIIRLCQQTTFVTPYDTL